jgi:hypothetical protein
MSQNNLEGFTRLDQMDFTSIQPNSKLILVRADEIDKPINITFIDTITREDGGKLLFKNNDKPTTSAVYPPSEIFIDDQWYLKPRTYGGSKRKPFHFNSQQKHMYGGKKTVRKVNIKNGKGYKSVSYYHKGKHIHTAKKPLSGIEIGLIKIGKFVPGLFKDCGCNKKTKKTRSKSKKGGSSYFKIDNPILAQSF